MTDIQEQIKYQRLTLADIGRQYPPEFIGGLAEDAASTVRDWMNINNAPRELIELLSIVTVLDRYAAARALTDQEAAELPEFVAAATRLIATCGGCFYSETGIIPTHPPAITANS